MGTQTSIAPPSTIGDQIPASACVPGVDYMVDCDENGHPPYRMTFKAASGGKYKFTDAIGARADLDATDKVWRLPPEQVAAQAEPVPVSELIPAILDGQAAAGGVPDPEPVKRGRGRKAKIVVKSDLLAGPEDFGGEDFPSAPVDGVHPVFNNRCPAGVEGCGNGCDSQMTHAIWASDGLPEPFQFVWRPFAPGGVISDGCPPSCRLVEGGARHLMACPNGAEQAASASRSDPEPDANSEIPKSIFNLLADLKRQLGDPENWSGDLLCAFAAVSTAVDKLVVKTEQPTWLDTVSRLLEAEAQPGEHAIEVTERLIREAKAGREAGAASWLDPSIVVYDEGPEPDLDPTKCTYLTNMQVDMLAGLLRDRALAIPKAALSAEAVDVLKRLRLVD